MANTRRQFIKQAGAGLMGSGFIGNSVFATNKHVETTKTLTNHSSTKEKLTLKVKKPIFCPYHSLETNVDGHWGGWHYYRNDAFTHNPFTIQASGMSGSPVIVDAVGKFVGFTNNYAYQDATFSFDGLETLTINVPKGQEVFIDESGNGDQAWRNYNALMLQRLGISTIKGHPEFWADVEYCTWVEQKKQSTKPLQHFNLLTHGFVKTYIKNIKALGYPLGKLTLDHGWGQFPDGSVKSGFGSWIPDSEKFPDFKGTMHMIQDNGFTPGLWIGFPKIQKESIIAKQQPNLLGSWNVGDTDKDTSAVRYLNPMGDIYGYASETIGRFYDMGVKKFKIDMSYNSKSDMIYIHKELYRAAKDIDTNIEMEFHVPDIFFAKYADVIRTNDVWLIDKFDWQSRVETHYKVAHQSACGKGINLDHIGGNASENLTEKQFLKHLDMYNGKTGYPLVSLLPSRVSNKCVEKTGDYLWDYHKNGRNIMSTYFN